MQVLDQDGGEEAAPQAHSLRKWVLEDLDGGILLGELRGDPEKKRKESKRREKNTFGPLGEVLKKEEGIPTGRIFENFQGKRLLKGIEKATRMDQRSEPHLTRLERLLG